MDADLIVQLCIALTGVLAAWVSHAPAERTRRWGCVLGLLGQPFWVWTAWHAGQWGVLACSAGYTLAFIRGVRVYWFSTSHPFTNHH